MTKLLKSLRNNHDEIDVRILKIPRSEYSIFKSLNVQSIDKNISFVYKPSLVHSFSVYPSSNLKKEYLRISLPIHYKTLNAETNINEYIENIDCIETNPYILFFLGQGKANIASFDCNHEMTAHKEISRIVQCQKIVKLKYPKKSPMFITNKNLLPFYKNTMIAIEKWWFYLLNKAKIDIPKDVNIGYMAEHFIWRDFWNLHRRVSEKENENEDIMPFNEYYSNLIRIGEYSMPYPKKSDLMRFSFGLREVHCFIDNALIDDEYFPKDIKNLMNDEELCWNPMVADETEMRNKRGQRINKKAIIENRKSSENAQIKPFEMKQLRKEKEKEAKIQKYKIKQSKKKLIAFDKESEKLNDLEMILNMTSNSKQPSKQEEIVRI